MDNIILKVENITYSYEDGTKALKGVSFEIEKGRKIAFLGANGSGKSTLFLCLNAILKPDAGTIYYNDEPIKYSKKGLLNLRSKVGIVFQEPDNQLFSASVYQEISFGVLNLGVSENEAKQRVEDVIEELEITPFRHKPIHFLSGGQKKNVAIADILVMNPHIIILDEPSSALDPHHTEIIYGMIDKLCKAGITVIISTHDVNHALEWADKVFVFKDGNIVSEGKPEELFMDSDTLQSSNLLQPTVIQLYSSWCKKGILDSSLPVPRTIETLEKYIENRYLYKMY